jgi:hypothetical protein
MSIEDDPRLPALRQELQQVLATAEPQPHRSWEEVTRDGEAIVLAFDVTETHDGTYLQELVGIAINDGKNLFMQHRRGSDWQVSKPLEASYDPVQEYRERWEAHPEIVTFGSAEGFVPYYDTSPDDEQFHGGMTLSVATCGQSIFVSEESSVLLSLDGSTRLVNIILEPEEARRLAKALEKGAGALQH